MKTKNTFLKKVASLCCLVVLIFSNSKLSAQVIYTDIPDATPSASYALDLNNDTIVDFIIQFDLGDRVKCYPQNNNAYAGNFVGNDYLPYALSSSSDICDTLTTWYDASNPGTMAWGTNIGNWVGATDKYLALKLSVGANTYYGWARLDILATSTSFTIKDYAYESTPDGCIQSGQTNVGIGEHTNASGVSMFPNPFNASTTIQTTRNLKNAKLTLCNAYGQTVKQVTSISGKTIYLSRDNLPSGVYFIQLTEENRIIAVEKLVITD